MKNKTLKIDYIVGKKKRDKIVFYTDDGTIAMDAIPLRKDTIVFTDYINDFRLLRLVKIAGNHGEVMNFELGKDPMITAITFDNTRDKRVFNCLGVRDINRVPFKLVILASREF